MIPVLIRKYWNRRVKENVDIDEFQTLIKTATILGKSGTGYTVFDIPITHWEEYPVKGIYLLTKKKNENSHQLIAIGESDNVSQSLKSKNDMDKAYCLYILFVKDNYERIEILKDIEKSISPAKKKSIRFVPQQVIRH